VASGRQSRGAFVFPTPLFFAALIDLISGDLGQLALTGTGLLSFWGAGTLTVAALVASALFLGQRPDHPHFR
jgi:hypothetical protein